MRQGIFPLFLLLASASPAVAIECHGNFQVVNGQEISTPYCRDNNLAVVARQYGYRDSDAAIRNNPARKEELCRHLNTDIRVQAACDDILPNSDGGR